MQSALVQQWPAEMQELAIPHNFSPVGHAHAPPGTGQTSPEIVQSPAVQHVPLGMHV